MDIVVELKTSPYNSSNYGKPWHAYITFDDTGKAKFTFGRWTKLDKGDGARGVHKIKGCVGEFIAIGQKDLRSGNSSTEYHEIVPEGLLYISGGLDKVYKAWTAARTPPGTTARRAMLEREKDRLLAELERVQMELFELEEA